MQIQTKSRPPAHREPAPSLLSKFDQDAISRDISRSGRRQRGNGAAAEFGLAAALGSFPAVMESIGFAICARPDRSASCRDRKGVGEISAEGCSAIRADSWLMDLVSVLTSTSTTSTSTSPFHHATVLPAGRGNKISLYERDDDVPGPLYETRPPRKTTCM